MKAIPISGVACETTKGQFTPHSLGRALTDVERAMLSDRQCGGLAFNTTSIRNEFDCRQPDQKEVAGVTLYEIQYRNKPNDPTVQG